MSLNIIQTNTETPNNFAITTIATIVKVLTCMQWTKIAYNQANREKVSCVVIGSPQITTTLINTIINRWLSLKILDRNVIIIRKNRFNISYRRKILIVCILRLRLCWRLLIRPRILLRNLAYYQNIQIAWLSH